MDLKFRRKIQDEDITFGSISTQTAFKAMKAPRKDTDTEEKQTLSPGTLQC